MEKINPTERVIYVSVVEYYGRVTVKPECPVSRAFCELLNQKTLTEANVEKIKKLGYQVRQKVREL